MKKFTSIAALLFCAAISFSFLGCQNPSISDDDSTEETQTPQPKAEKPKTNPPAGNNQVPPAPAPNPDPEPDPLPEELTTPLTLEAIGDGRFGVKNPWTTLKYKKNGGEFQTLTVVEESGNRFAIIDASDGDKFEFFADGSENDNSNGSEIFMHFGSDTEYYVYGNIMSLLDSQNYSTKTDITEEYAFSCLFADNDVKMKEHNTKKLVLPATSLSKGCYMGLFAMNQSFPNIPELPAETLAPECYCGMFASCDNLTRAPELPATTLVEKCYESMFSGCESLNYVKCLATSNTAATDCTKDWLEGVSDTGTFVKAAGAVWTSGPSGMPIGWTEPGQARVNISNSTNGSVTTSTHIVTEGETVTLTISPATGYELNTISATTSEGPVSLNGTGSTRTFTMPAGDVTVSASFTQSNYTVSFGSFSHGSVTASKTSNAHYGDSITLTINPSAGYELSTISVPGVTLSGDGYTSGSTRTFKMPAGNVTVNATFTAINYSITTSGIANGTVTAKNSSGQAITSATYGQTVTLEIAAANYYEYTADSINVTGVTNLGGSGLTRSFNMPAQNVTVSATFFTGPTVAATETKELGDIVLDNGLVVRYADRDKMTASQKSAAVAIIFDAANKKGVGVKIGEKKKWCSDGAGLYNTNEYTVSEEDGYANKTAAHQHMGVWSAGAYPSFWLAEVENRKGIYNDDNWYLPASKELITLFANLETVNNSFDALGITTKIVEGDWTWSSSCPDPSKIHQDTQTAAIFASDSKGIAFFGKENEIKACGVRVFN